MTHDVAIVVGVGPGLGWALVRRFAEAGMKIAAASRDAAHVKNLLETERVKNVHAYACDATEVESVDQLFTDVEGHLGVPGAVIFNAGTFEPGSVAEIDPADFERCWRVGCFGGFLIGRAAARAMMPKGQGTIVFTGATASLRGSARFANLAVPKFGLRALAQSMAREFGPQGIHVAHVIIDGQIESDRYRHLADERGPDSLLKPADIAEMYYQVHRQPRSAWTHELDLRPWVEKF